MPLLLQKRTAIPGGDPQAVVEQRLRDGKEHSFLLVVPTNRKVRDFERTFLRLVPGQAAGRFNLFTLSTLAVELHALTGRSRRPVEGPAQAILLHQAVRNIAGDLRYFRVQRNGRALPTGTFQKILNVLNRLKEEGVYPSMLRMELGSADSADEHKLHDVLAIVEEYERLLGDRFIDAGGYLRELNAGWDAEFNALVRKRFHNADLLVVSGFNRFSDPELTMLAALSELPALASVVSFDYFPGNRDVFGHLEENYRKFLGVGFTPLTVDQFAPNPFTDHVARQLFRHDGGMEMAASAPAITLLDAPSRREEVRQIARLIKQRAHGLPDGELGAVCVAMFDPAPYTALFREVFDEYGIAANITDRYGLDQSPVVIAFLSLLAIQERNFRVRDIMRALTTPYFSFGEGEDRIDAGTLHAVAAKLKIGGTRSTWEKRIDRRLREVADRAAAADDDIELRELMRERSTLQHARDDLRRIGDLLAPFASPLLPREFRERVGALLRRLRVDAGILAAGLRFVTDEQREKDARAYQKFLHFLDEYFEILEMQDQGDIPRPLSFYLDALRTAVPYVRYNIRQKWNWGVQVTTMEETRGLGFDVMIVAGLVDGEFPPVYQPEMLFGRARRELFEQRHLVEHRYLFYQAITNCASQLILTAPRRDGNAQLVPSSFLDALGRIAAVDDRRGVAAGGDGDPICSVEEFLQHAGTVQGNVDVEAIGDRGIIEEIRGTLEQMRTARDVEQSRQEPAGFPEYNGRILGSLSPASQRALELLRQRTYSVTQLESYGRCPFQFFAEKLLRLSAAPEVEEGVTPAERGALVHEILFQFYTERREQQCKPIFECDDGEFTEATERMRAIAREKVDRLVTDDALWEIEKELFVGTRERMGVLAGFLELERSRPYTVRPAYFEVAFGTRAGGRASADSTLGHPEPLEAGQVRLRGKIDRIDAGDGVVKIIDYKTGSTPFSRDELDLGMSLQLPVYLYAVERILLDAGSAAAAPAAGVEIRLRSPVKEDVVLANGEFKGKVIDKGSRSRGVLPGDAELRDAIAKAIGFVNTYVDSIARGEFPVAPQKPERVCRSCDMKTICRIQARLPIPDAADGEEER